MDKYIIGKCNMCGIDMIVGTPIEDKVVCHNCYCKYEKDKIDFLQELSNKQKQTIADLEAKLAESQNCACKNIGELTKIATEKDRKIEELKQQLAEKDEELHSANVGEEFALKCCDEANKLLVLQVAGQHQDKISFAVEQLEKVKEYIDNHKYKTINDDRYVVYRKSLVDQINNQIKQLKEGK